MVTKYNIPSMPCIRGNVVHQKVLYVLSYLTLYIMLATGYFVPWIYLLPDNLTFYIHMAAINVSKFFYLIFFRYPYYGYQNIMWDYLELNIFMAQNNISPKGKKNLRKSFPHIKLVIYAIFGYHGYEYANELKFKKNEFILHE